MDFQNAIMLTAFVYGAVALLKTLLRVQDQRVTVLITIVAAVGSIFLFRYSVWAHEQVIGNVPLDQLGVASMIIAGLFLAGVETAAFSGVQAIKNIGMNQPITTPTGASVTPGNEAP